MIITKDRGKQALLTNDIETIQLFEHIGGFDLMSRFKQQVEYERMLMRSFPIAFRSNETHSRPMITI
jgi:hypothetical protein